MFCFEVDAPGGFCDEIYTSYEVTTGSSSSNGIFIV